MNDVHAADWQRVRALFAHGVQLPAAARSAWLDEVCADRDDMRAMLQDLLDGDAAHADALERGAAELVARLLRDGASAAPERSGERFGPYTIVRLLGAGGMGSVYLAQRTDGHFQQQVALKVIGADVGAPLMRELFLRERQILARLNHPNIAQLHDGGVSADGALYFTMELVEGEPITAYCDARNLGLAARLNLFLKACAAVQFAHRNLIVHRDLKPSNILVTAQGEVKLLDFGIAKLLDDEFSASATSTHTRVMTREYAAPEQILAQPITTATDVYALGVLLFELLTGQLPYARAVAGEASWPQAIIEDAPQSLHGALVRGRATAPGESERRATQRAGAVDALRRRLRGDLDRIVRRALEKSPDARYQVVGELVIDVQAWLDGRALPGGSWRYRAAKFIRRNRWPLAIAAAVALALIVEAAGIVWQSREARRAAERALAQAQTTMAVKDFLVELFNGSDPANAQGKEISARSLLDRGAEGIAARLQSQPRLRAELQSVLGQIYNQLGLYHEAEALEQQALASSAGSDGDPLIAAASVRERAAALVELGQVEEAIALAADAVARLRALPAAPAQDRVRALVSQVQVMMAARKTAGAEPIADEAVSLARANALSEDTLAGALSARAMVAWYANQFKDAEGAFREVIAVHRRARGDLNPALVADYRRLAATLINTGEYTEAIAAAASAASLAERLYGAKNIAAVSEKTFLGTLNMVAGNYAAAKALYSEALPVQRELLGDDHPEVARSMVSLANMEIASGEFAAAEQLAAQAYAANLKQHGADFDGTILALASLAEAHGGGGKLDLAEKEFRETIQRQDATDRVPHTNEDMHLADVLRMKGDLAHAEVLAASTVKLAVATYGERSRQAAGAHSIYGLVLRDQAKQHDAEAELRASIGSYRAMLPPDGLHPLSATPRMALGQLLMQRADSRAEGIAHLRTALELRERVAGPDNRLANQTRKALDEAIALQSK
jgi:serine/threonine protein kinase